MIDDKIEEGDGIYNNFKIGYREGINLAKKCEVYIGNDKEGSFFERQSRESGAVVALYFFPITHPRDEWRNLKGGVRKLRRYIRRKNN